MSKQSPPVWEVIDRQQGVVGCWCVEWGEEEDEEIEDKKPAKCLHSNQLCDTFWRSDKQKSLWVWLLVDTKFTTALIRGGLVANYQRAEKIGTMRAIGLFQWQTFAVAVVCRLCFSKGGHIFGHWPNFTSFDFCPPQKRKAVPGNGDVGPVWVEDPGHLLQGLHLVWGEQVSEGSQEGGVHQFSHCLPLKSKE